MAVTICHNKIFQMTKCHKVVTICHKPKMLTVKNVTAFTPKIIQAGVIHSLT